MQRMVENLTDVSGQRVAPIFKGKFLGDVKDGFSRNVCNNFEVRHPRCVGSITKNFLCITHTVEHNYISPNSTVGIQLHVSALYVGHLQVVI